MTDKKRRAAERLKTLLIILLSLSALFLLSLSPLVTGSGLSAFWEDGLSSPDTSGTTASSFSSAVPAQLAVGSELGLYGVQYDQQTADALFEQVGSILGEALNTAREPVPLTERRWLSRLSGGFVYLDFVNSVPLSALCSWLRAEDSLCTIPHSARRLILARESDGSLSLCYRVEKTEEYFLCATNLSAELHLSPLLSAIRPNGAFFAFEDNSLPSVIAPYTLFTGGELSPGIYNASTPLLLAESAQTGQLLSALSFSDQNRANVSEGILYVDGDDTLRLSVDGRVTYNSSGSERYPAGQSLPDAVKAAWSLADAALTPLCGEARLTLLSAEEEKKEGQYTVSIGYMLEGSPLHLYDQGWAAHFVIENGFIQEFTLNLRSYTHSGQTKLLLPAEKAAAALTALTDTPMELVIRYHDNGGSTVEPGWIAR